MPDVASKTPYNESKVRKEARALLRARTPRAVALLLGVSRETVLSLAAGTAVTRGTLALVAQRLAHLEKLVENEEGVP